MLEHAVRFDLVERGLEETLLLQFVVVIVVSNRCELLGFLVEEFKVSSALVLHVFRLLGFGGPFILIAPLFFVLLIVETGVLEIIFLLGFFAICINLAVEPCGFSVNTYSSKQREGSGIAEQFPEEDVASPAVH